MDKISAPLQVTLDSVGYPASIQLSYPDMFVQTSMRPDAWSIIVVPVERLLAELMRDVNQDGFSSQDKLTNLRRIVSENAIHLPAPAIQVADNLPVNRCSFFDGRHRTFVLAELGARAIPVAVPWGRVNEFIEYFNEPLAL